MTTSTHTQKESTRKSESLETVFRRVVLLEEE
jgi:hypothetical protein